MNKTEQDGQKSWKVNEKKRIYWIGTEFFQLKVTDGPRSKLSNRGFGCNVPILTGRGCVLLHPTQQQRFTVGRKKT